MGPAHVEGWGKEAGLELPKWASVDPSEGSRAGYASGSAHIYSCSKCPQKLLVHAKRSLKFGLIQNVCDIFGPCQMVLDIWSCQKHPCLENIFGFKQPIPFISTFGLQNEYIKNTIMLYWSSNCGCIANNNPCCHGNLLGNGTLGLGRWVSRDPVSPGTFRIGPHVPQGS